MQVCLCKITTRQQSYEFQWFWFHHLRVRFNVSYQNTSNSTIVKFHVYQRHVSVTRKLLLSLKLFMSRNSIFRWVNYALNKKKKKKLRLSSSQFSFKRPMPRLLSALLHTQLLIDLLVFIQTTGSSQNMLLLVKVRSSREL